MKPQYFFLVLLNLLILKDMQLSSDIFSEENSSQAFVISLDQAIEIALNNGRTVEAEYNLLQGAQVNEDLSRTIFDWRILPRGETAFTGGGTAGTGLTLGAGIDLLKKFETGSSLVIGPSILKSNDKYHANMRFHFTQPLLRGFGRDYNLAGVYAAEYSTRSAARSLQKSLTNTILRTIELVYEIAKQKEIVTFCKLSLDKMKEFNRMTHLKEKLGFADSLDLFRADIDLKTEEEACRLAEDRLKELHDNLNDLLNLPLCIVLDVNVELVHTQMQLDYDVSVKTALNNRIELAQAWDQLMESERLRKLACKNLAPSLNLVLDYTNLGWDETFTGSFGRKREARWGVGFTTEGSADRSLEKATYQQSILNVENVKRACIDIKNGIILEVKKQIQGLEQLRIKIRFHQDQIKALETQVKLAKLKFLRGLASNFDVIQAEKALRSANMSLIAEIADHKVAEYRLLAIMGLLNEDIIADD